MTCCSELVRHFIGTMPLFTQNKQLGCQAALVVKIVSTFEDIFWKVSSPFGILKKLDDASRCLSLNYVDTEVHFSLRGK